MTERTGDGRIRLTVLGGYLGSGKTTWLRHQLFNGTFGDAHIIVNEAAETPVDDALLAEHAGAMTLLAGGCVCCTGKADLIATLRDLCNARSRTSASEDRLEQIVLETSGLADPAAIVTAIKEDPVLVYHILVTEIIVAVDAANAIAQLSDEPLGRQQIEAADRLLLTKVDTVTNPTLSRLVGTLKGLNPAAELSAAVKGIEQVLEIDPDAPPVVLPAFSGSDTRDPVLPMRIEIDPSIDWAAFSVWLSALLYARGKDIVRVKGVLHSPAGHLLLQAVRNSVQSPEILPKSASNHNNSIVFIGRGFSADALRKSLQHFVG